MNCVIYYSNTEQSKTIAEYFSQKTSFPLFDINNLSSYDFDTVILVFPVHCQNIPKPVKCFLAKLQVKTLTVIATYGKMCYGNVLYEIQKHYKHNIVAAAYVPTKHTYLTESGFNDFNALCPIISKISDPTPITIPKSYKNPLSNICMGLRSRIGVKIRKDYNNCNNCGKCNAVCNNNAITYGKTNRKCIRCLKCVENCPTHALHFINRLPMRIYLSKNKTDKTVVYI
ncbi:MAG: 4Fe-4S binding protein [Clostridiales bacterium]|nr:4Fe-4S binding protein [Clostridiales bacterium]